LSDRARVVRQRSLGVRSGAAPTAARRLLLKLYQFWRRRPIRAAASVLVQRAC
jgi:hypothetical protein